MEIPEQAEKLKNILDGPKAQYDLIEFVKETDRELRENIARCFNEMYPETGGFDNYVEDIPKEATRLIAKSLFDTRATTTAEKLKEAIGVFGIDVHPVYEMLFNYPEWLREETKKKFHEITKKNLLYELQTSFVDPIKSILEVFLFADRENNGTPDKEECDKFAKLLTETNPEEWLSTDTIVEKFNNFSPEELTLVCRYYAKICDNGAGIIDALKMMKKSQKKFLKNLLYYRTIPPLKYAQTINGLLNKIDLPQIDFDRQLLDIIGSRHDVDLPLINEFYKKKYGVDIRDEIADKLADRKDDPVYLLINAYFKKAYVQQALKDNVKLGK